jgi:hypothetical protein
MGQRKHDERRVARRSRHVGGRNGNVDSFRRAAGQIERQRPLDVGDRRASPRNHESLALELNRAPQIAVGLVATWPSGFIAGGAGRSGRRRGKSGINGPSSAPPPMAVSWLRRSVSAQTFTYQVNASTKGWYGTSASSSQQTKRGSG